MLAFVRRQTNGGERWEPNWDALEIALLPVPDVVIVPTHVRTADELRACFGDRGLTSRLINYNSSGTTPISTRDPIIRVDTPFFAGSVDQAIATARNGGQVEIRYGTPLYQAFQHATNRHRYVTDPSCPESKLQAAGIIVRSETRGDGLSWLVLVHDPEEVARRRKSDEDQLARTVKQNAEQAAHNQQMFSAQESFLRVWVSVIDVLLHMWEPMRSPRPPWAKPHGSRMSLEYMGRFTRLIRDMVNLSQMTGNGHRYRSLPQFHALIERWTLERKQILVGLRILVLRQGPGSAGVRSRQQLPGVFRWLDRQASELRRGRTGEEYVRPRLKVSEWLQPRIRKKKDTHGRTDNAADSRLGTIIRSILTASAPISSSGSIPGERPVIVAHAVSGDGD